MSPQKRQDDPFDYGLQEDYEDLFAGRAARRTRRIQRHSKSARRRAQEKIESVADLGAAEGEFSVTYTPSLHEAGWLLQSLRPFFDQELISDVLYIVKGGKEANVYCCRAHPAIGVDYLAAKVYRPHVFRQIRNDAVYRTGRSALDDAGNAIVNDRRSFRAVQNRTRFGRRLQRVSWLMYEYTTMELLYEAGATVPQPHFATENAILMAFLGDADLAAPTLSQVRPEPEALAPLFTAIMGDVALMLEQGLVHGDLSAYNILFWGGKGVLIDFPQVVDLSRNPHAPRLFLRDVTRLCDYFNRQGLPVDAAEIADTLWRTYAKKYTSAGLHDPLPPPPDAEPEDA